MMKKIIEQLEERKIQMKEAEFEYFNKQYEEPINSPLRAIYRGFSNEFHARRDELERVIKILNEETLESEKSVCPACSGRDVFSVELTHYKCRSCDTQWTN